MQLHTDSSDITQTAIINGAKIVTFGGRGPTFWAVRLPFAPAGIDEMCYSGLLDEKGGMPDFLRTIDAWAAAGTTQVSCKSPDFHHALRDWATECHNKNLFLAAIPEVETAPLAPNLTK